MSCARTSGTGTGRCRTPATPTTTGGAPRLTPAPPESSTAEGLIMTAGDRGPGIGRSGLRGRSTAPLPPDEGQATRHTAARGQAGPLGIPGPEGIPMTNVGLTPSNDARHRGSFVSRWATTDD